MDQKTVNKIGWLASILACLMFSSYIDQIRLNLSGQPGSVILPIATTINCTVWVSYGWFKTKKDWPIILCNSLGVILGLATAITTLV